MIENEKMEIKNVGYSKHDRFEKSKKFGQISFYFLFWNRLAMFITVKLTSDNELKKRKLTIVVGDQMNRRVQQIVKL